MNRHVVGSLIVVGVLALLAAGFFFINVPIIKMSGPNAFEAIERHYVDFERVNRDIDTRRQYDFYKSLIMNIEPGVRSMLRDVRMAGIAFSLLVSVCSFGLAYHLRNQNVRASA